MRTSGRLERWGRIVLVAGATSLLVAAVVDGDWLRVVPYLVLALVFGGVAWRSRGEDRRQSRSTALARTWPPARVRELSARAGGQHVDTVKALRIAEPELTLRDAHELVRRALRQDTFSQTEPARPACPPSRPRGPRCGRWPDVSAETSSLGSSSLRRPTPRSRHPPEVREGSRRRRA